MGITTALTGVAESLGLGEALGGIGSFLGLGGGEAAAAGLGAAGAEGLGALGTAESFMAAPTFDALGGAALAGTGAGVEGTAGAFLAAPGASLLGAGGAGLGSVGAEAALASAAESGLASGTGSIASAGLPGSAFESALSGAGIGGGSGAAGASGSSGVFPSPNATPGVMTTGAPTTSAVPGLSAAGPGGPAAAGSAVAPTGAAAGVGAAVDPASAAAKAAGGGSFWDQMVAGATKNALPAAIAAGGLGYNVLKGSGSTPSQTALNSQAAALAKSSPELMGYLTSGTLPAGMQTGLDKATKDAKTAAVSRAAASGQPTDPSRNSTLAAELAQIDQQESVTAAQLGQQLLTAGLSESQLSATEYQALMNAEQGQQKAISDSIANFAKALGGMGGGINLKIA